MVDSYMDSASRRLRAKPWRGGGPPIADTFGNGIEDFETVCAAALEFKSGEARKENNEHEQEPGGIWRERKL